MFSFIHTRAYPQMSGFVYFSFLQLRKQKKKKKKKKLQVISSNLFSQIDIQIILKIQFNFFILYWENEMNLAQTRFILRFSVLTIVWTTKITSYINDPRIIFTYCVSDKLLLFVS